MINIELTQTWKKNEHAIFSLKLYLTSKWSRYQVQIYTLRIENSNFFFRRVRIHTGNNKKKIKLSMLFIIRKLFYVFLWWIWRRNSIDYLTKQSKAYYDGIMNFYVKVVQRTDINLLRNSEEHLFRSTVIKYYTVKMV